jgi:hypothetical protein
MLTFLAAYGRAGVLAAAATLIAALASCHKTIAALFTGVARIIVAVRAPHADLGR